MGLIERFFDRENKNTTGNIVYDEIKKIEGMGGRLARNASMYLELALRWGLASRAIIDSCYDLATTTTLPPQEERNEQRRWQDNRKKRLSLGRPPRVIQMQLYPSYFDAILKGDKTYEGRAFDPFSEKDYLDLREGDEIIFNVCREVGNWQDQCGELGLDPGSY